MLSVDPNGLLVVSQRDSDCTETFVREYVVKKCAYCRALIRVTMIGVSNAREIAVREHFGKLIHICTKCAPKNARWHEHQEQQEQQFRDLIDEAQSSRAFDERGRIPTLSRTHRRERSRARSF